MVEVEVEGEQLVPREGERAERAGRDLLPGVLHGQVAAQVVGAEALLRAEVAVVDPVHLGRGVSEVRVHNGGRWRQGGRFRQEAGVKEASDVKEASNVKEAWCLVRTHL
jgi:hypothetical protein